MLIFAAVALMLWPYYGLMAPLIDEAATPESPASYSIVDKNSSVATPQIQRTLTVSNERTEASKYCRIEECKTVSCSSISREYDSGAIAGNFIETVYKVNCKNSESVNLSFDGCRFTANTLRKNWLPTNVSIEQLTLDRCSLSEIEDDAFSEPIYEETKRIALTNNKLSSLRKASFRGLSALQQLTVRDNVVKQAEYNLLENVAGSLTSLELNSVIDDPSVLRNITGGSTRLKIRLLSLQGNTLAAIDRKLFEGVPVIESLYLDNSRIGTVSRDTLRPMASWLLQLTLNNNDIRSLPEGLFEAVLYRQRSFLMTVDSNPWCCDCKLRWMQHLFRTNTSIVSTMPVCSTPEINAGKSFANANFCPSDTTVPNTVSVEDAWNRTTVQGSGTTEAIVSGGYDLNCSIPETITETTGIRKLLSSDIHLPSRLYDFYVQEILNRSIMIHLPRLDKGVELLWFANNDVDQSLGCAKNVKDSYLVQGTHPQTTYTICLLNDSTTIVTVSPLNCLAVTTRSTYESSVWLTNANRRLAFLTLSLASFLCFVLGAFVAFLVVRRNPSLLRGSKRVMLVKRRNVDVIVLPKGVAMVAKKRVCGSMALVSNKLYEDGYITPLPPIPTPVPRERASRASLQSDWNSYVSEIESMDTDYWRTKRWNNESRKQKLDAPPLPPHPFNAIPSVSLTMDSLNKDSVYQAITI
ncbi:uncharacterized protein LOC143145048 isoform X2 [Ptiloglossa arizonensis]